VAHCGQRLERAVGDPARRAALGVSDEADPAGVVLRAKTGQQG
jgi:hypothetical protein